MQSTIFDVFIIGGLALGGFLGYKAGFTKKIFNVLVLVIGIVISVHLMIPFGELLQDFSIAEPWCYLIGVSIILIAILIGSMLLYRRFGKEGMAKSSSQYLGVIFGVFEGALIISLILIGMNAVDVPSAGIRTGSILYKPMLNTAPKTFEVLRPYLPGAGGFMDALTKAFKDLDLGDKVPDIMTR